MLKEHQAIASDIIGGDNTYDMLGNKDEIVKQRQNYPSSCIYLGCSIDSTLFFFLAFLGKPCLHAVNNSQASFYGSFVLSAFTSNDDKPSGSLVVHWCHLKLSLPILNIIQATSDGIRLPCHYNFQTRYYWKRCSRSSITRWL